jgi:hypothetical protein
MNHGLLVNGAESFLTCHVKKKHWVYSDFQIVSALD